jgi:hypothetical protein
MDDGRLSAVLAGKRLTFAEWADWFLQKRSKPPYRAEKTHRENLNQNFHFGRPGTARVAETTVPMQ